jgi:hypothetical protein
MKVPSILYGQHSEVVGRLTSANKKIAAGSPLHEVYGEQGYINSNEVSGNFVVNRSKSLIPADSVDFDMAITFSDNCKLDACREPWSVLALLGERHAIDEAGGSKEKRVFIPPPDPETAEWFGTPLIPTVSRYYRPFITSLLQFWPMYQAEGKRFLIGANVLLTIDQAVGTTVAKYLQECGISVNDIPTYDEFLTGSKLDVEKLAPQALENLAAYGF